MIELPRSMYDGLIAHAEAGAPDEVCGVLGGEYGDDRSVVQSYHRAANAAETPRTEYAIDPEEQLELIDAIEDEGQAVTGFYHSHPAGPPGPSRTDAARATWPGLSYVIVVLDGEQPYIGSWRWNDEHELFEQEIVRRV
ncbi:MAG: desampylase [Halobacteriales archaeon]